MDPRPYPYHLPKKIHNLDPMSILDFNLPIQACNDRIFYSVEKPTPNQQPLHSDMWLAEIMESAPG